MIICYLGRCRHSSANCNPLTFCMPYFTDSVLFQSLCESAAACSSLSGNLLDGRSPCVKNNSTYGEETSLTGSLCLDSPQLCKEGSGYRGDVVKKRDVGSCKVMTPAACLEMHVHGELVQSHWCAFVSAVLLSALCFLTLDSQT